MIRRTLEMSLGTRYHYTDCISIFVVLVSVSLYLCISVHHYTVCISNFVVLLSLSLYSNLVSFIDHYFLTFSRSVPIFILRSLL